MPSLDLFCASVSMLCPKVIAASRYTISAYKTFQLTKGFIGMVYFQLVGATCMSPSSFFPMPSLYHYNFKFIYESSLLIIT